MAAITHVDGAVDLNAGATYSGGALPSDGDTLTFNRAGASFELTNLTALNGKDLLTLTIGPAWAASIGSSAQALEVNCNRSGAGAVDYKGTGRVFSIKGGASTPTISTITFRPSNGASSVGFLSGAANTMLRVFGGSFRVENSASVVAVQAMRSRVEIMEHASDSVGDMVLADGATSPHVKDYTLCCELFDGNDEDAVKAARARWSAYKADGHELTYFQQDEQGRWVKK